MSTSELDRILQNELDTLLSENDDIFSVVLGVSHAGGDFEWIGGGGTADAARGDPMTASSPFYLASVTKMYTAAATMILDELGKLALMAPLNRYLPAETIAGLHIYKGQDYSDQLTVYHLLSQTSGLADYFEDKPEGGKSLLERIVEDGDQGWELREVLRVTKEDLTPKFPPGPTAPDASRRKAGYSDTNFQLLGAVIESATGKSLQAVFSELIIEPLGLNSTYLYGWGKPHNVEAQPPATIYFKQKPSHLENAMASFGPDGGMVSTLEDSLNFARNFFEGNLFTDPATLSRMQSWSSLFFPFQYGLGLMRFKLPWIMSPFSRTPELIGHLGASSAFLMRSDMGPLYITGTLNQLDNQRRPVQWMLKIIEQVNKAL